MIRSRKCSLPRKSTAEDSVLTFSAATGNAITVGDLDGDTLTTTLSVTNGVLNLGTVAGVTVTGDGTGTVTISGSAAAINAALDGLALQSDRRLQWRCRAVSYDDRRSDDGKRKHSRISITAVADIVANAIIDQ